MRKKSPYFRTSSSLKMAVRGGFEPPIRCRIHTFQACSFSHSDTSPNFYCLTTWGQRGATIGSWSKTVKKNLFRLICLVTQWTHDSFARDYGRMRSDQLFIKSYEGNMRVKKYQSTHFLEWHVTHWFCLLLFWRLEKGYEPVILWFLTVNQSDSLLLFQFTAAQAA